MALLTNPIRSARAVPNNAPAPAPPESFRNFLLDIFLFIKSFVGEFVSLIDHLSPFLFPITAEISCLHKIALRPKRRRIASAATREGSAHKKRRVVSQ